MKLIKLLLISLVVSFLVGCEDDDVADVVVYPPKLDVEEECLSRGDMRVKLQGLEDPESNEVSYFIECEGVDKVGACTATFNQAGEFVIKKAPAKKFTLRIIFPAVVEGARFESLASDEVSSRQSYNGSSELPMSGEVKVAREMTSIECPCNSFGSFLALKIDGRHVFRSLVLTSNKEIADGSNQIFLSFNQPLDAQKYVLIRVKPGEEQHDISFEGYDDDGCWLLQERLSTVLAPSVATKQMIHSDAATQKTYEIGQHYYDGIIEGIIVHLNEEKTKGKIISLDQRACVWAAGGYVEPEWWIDDLCSPKVSEKGGPYRSDKSVTVQWDGKGNTQKIKDFCTKKGIPFDDTTFPAASWCDAKNGSGKRVWYLPATDEILSYIIDNQPMLATVLPTTESYLGSNVVGIESGRLYWASSQREFRKTGVEYAPSKHAQMVRNDGTGGFREEGGDLMAGPKGWASPKAVARAMADF